MYRLADADDLLFHLDKFLTVTLQENRPDLYFLHAAAVALEDRTAVLAAPSGTGKSTLTLALLESGFAYLSDELTPIDVTRLLAHPYAHALCLKAPVRRESPLAHAGIAVGKRVHIPAGLLRAPSTRGPSRLAAVFFLTRSGPSAPICRRIDAAESAAHLLANSLNGLAHEAAGLKVAVSLAQRVPCFQLNSFDLGAAGASIYAVLRGPESSA
jgi:hypothetical protein